MVIFFIFSIVTVFGQDYPSFEGDMSDTKDESLIFSLYSNEFDFVLSKHMDGYWFEKVHYEVIGFIGKKIKKILVVQDKNSKQYKIKNIRVSKNDNRDYYLLLIELAEKDFFNFSNSALNKKDRIKDDSTRTVMQVMDCYSYYFEIIHKENYKQLYSYCPEDYLKKFPEMKERKIYLDCIELFNNYWKEL